MLNLVGRYLVFVLIGVVIGSGEFTFFDWRWWAWCIAINAAMFLRDYCLEVQASEPP